MAADRSKRHRHKYHYVVFGATHVWACALPDCSHYMPKHMEAMAEGKASICWQCGGEMILDKTNMKEVQPRCENCRLGIEITELPISAAMAERLTKPEPEKTKVSISEETILGFLNSK